LVDKDFKIVRRFLFFWAYSWKDTLNFLTSYSFSSPVDHPKALLHYKLHSPTHSHIRRTAWFKQCYRLHTPVFVKAMWSSLSSTMILRHIVRGSLGLFPPELQPPDLNLADVKHAEEEPFKFWWLWVIFLKIATPRFSPLFTTALIGMVCGLYVCIHIDRLFFKQLKVINGIVPSKEKLRPY